MQISQCKLSPVELCVASSLWLPWFQHSGAGQFLTHCYPPVYSNQGGSVLFSLAAFSKAMQNHSAGEQVIPQWGMETDGQMFHPLLFWWNISEVPSKMVLYRIFLMTKLPFSILVATLKTHPSSTFLPFLS